MESAKRPFIHQSERRQCSFGCDRFAVTQSENRRYLYKMTQVIE